MIILLIQSMVAVFVGLAGGVTVGSGIVAFLIMLDIIPRLTQLTLSWKHLRKYEVAIILGSVVFTWLDFYNVHFHLFPLGAALVGLFAGCFIGMLAGALTEVINVLPILAKRMGMESYMIRFLMAMILGKVIGSLLEWLIY
jgi:stage V sporulation protein AB